MAIDGPPRNNREPENFAIESGTGAHVLASTLAPTRIIGLYGPYLPLQPFATSQTIRS
jgi:hypothetical protein